MGNYFIFGLCVLKSKTQYSFAVSVSLFMLTHFTDSLTRSMVFPVPTRFTCSCSRTSCCNYSGIVTFFHFMIFLSITVNSSLNVHYGLNSWHISFWLDGHPSIMCSFRFSRWRSFYIAFHMSWLDIPYGLTVTTLKTLMLNFMPSISSYFYMYGFVSIPNLICRGTVLFCTMSIFCINVSWAGCIGAAGIMLQCLFWILWLEFCDQLLCLPL